MKLSKCYSICAYFYGYVLKEKPGYPVLLVGFILATAAAPFLNIILPKYLIDELLGGQNLTRIIGYVVFLVVGNFCFAVLIRVLQEDRTKKEDWFARMFDLMMSKKSMDMKFEYTESESALDAEQKAETGMSWYSGGVRGMSDCVAGMAAAMATLLGVAYLVVKISPWLLLLSSVAVGIQSFCTSKINQASQEVFEKTPAINKFYSYIYTKITFREYAKELRLYDGTDLIEKKAIQNAKELNAMDNECARKQFRWGSVGAVVSAVSYGGSYCYLGIMAICGSISVSEFVMCIAALETFTNGCLLPLIHHFQALVMKCNFMSAFISFMELEDERQQGTETITGDFEELCFDHVSFQYPGTDHYVLKDISLTIHKGERISLVGLNGTGKSTLVKLICRLYDVTEGEIRINGKNIMDYAYNEYIKMLSVVFQDFKLFGYTLDENICMGATDRNPADYSAADREKIYEISGIAPWVKTLKKQGDTLLGKEFDPEGVEPSGGQAQKIAIARALYRDAPLVILDEPTAALDPVAEYEIYHHFHKMVQNKTAIYISHRLSSCKFCDRIVVLGGNRIQEMGSHDELMEKKGVYAKLFQTQAKWYVSEGGL
ncbi:MAG: ABC transporter ATP-binding protein [Eubacterium sp.]|nr:ABC transporter ATP-binding protein [Eubacterium sp.]